MRTKVTLVLIFLNVALFFFIFGFEREWRIREEAQQARRRVLGPEAANIQTLEIAGTGFAEPLRLRRTTDAWMLTSPVEWPANQHAVSRIVSALQLLEHETSFSVPDLTAAGQTLADYGLENPGLTVTFAGAAPSGDPAEPASTPVTLSIGAETSVGNRLYLLSPDRQRVHVVDRSLADSLRVTLEQLRAETCFTIEVFEVRSLNLQTAGPANTRVRLRKDGDRWSFEVPITARASRVDMELTVRALNLLRTREFLGSARTRPELARLAGTTTPSLRITLEGNNRRETLLLGNEVSAAAPAVALPPGVAPGAAPPGGDDAAVPPERLYYAQVEDRDAVFTVSLPTDLLQTLRNAQEELRDPHVLPLEDREVTAVTIAAPNYPDLTLQRLEPPTGAGDAPASWQIVRAGSGGGLQTRPADREIVQRLIQHLTLLSAQQFLRDVPSDAELESWGLMRPERTITVTLLPDPANPTSPTTLTLLLGVANERQNRVYAKLANQTFVYLVSPDILRATPVVPRLYRDRLLDEMPAGARVTGITLTQLPDGPVLYTRNLGPNETWENVFAAETPARSAALTALHGHLRTLRAKSFVLDAFAATVPLQGEDRPWAYRLDATLALTGGGTEQRKLRTLYFAPRSGGATQLVGSPEFDVVFEAEQSLLDAIWVLTYGPNDPGPPAADPPASRPNHALDPALDVPVEQPDGDRAPAPEPPEQPVSPGPQP